MKLEGKKEKKKPMDPKKKAQVCRLGMGGPAPLQF
jgi:hypothetical protein